MLTGKYRDYEIKYTVLNVSTSCLFAGLNFERTGESYNAWLTTPMAIINLVRHSGTVPVSGSSNALNIALAPAPVKDDRRYVLGVIKKQNKQNKPCKPVRAATVTGKPLMASPVAACTSGTRGETPMF